MARLPHGSFITLQEFQEARSAMAVCSSEVPMAFAAALPADLQDFDYLFGDLQTDPNNLLPETAATPENLILLGRSLLDSSDTDSPGDSEIPAAYTYFGQFVDHDVTLETISATLPDLLDPDLAPLSLETVRQTIRNARTATPDLDSVYGLPAPRSGDRMEIGKVTALNGTDKPLLRPPGKGEDNDLVREPRNADDPVHDRAALTGDPRNDENLIIAQLHVAFLRAHNALAEQGKSFDEARRLLRQHYQHIVLHDFLPRVCDPQIVKNILQYGNKVYDSMAEPFFLPLEFSVAAYRFGHSMVRAEYDFNLNFNTSGQAGTIPATLGLLFTFTALSGGLGLGEGTDTLPDNWIIEWENFVETCNGRTFNRARRLDTRLVEPLFQLPDIQGIPEPGDGARLAVRNLLRGYLLRMPTGQAVARALGHTPLTPREIETAAASAEQVEALRRGCFLDRTPLWFYILAEAAHCGGEHLGSVGSTIVAEVLIGLAYRSEDSILRTYGWKPSLPGSEEGTFELADLLRLAGVLSV